jgi:hypothetical protein
VFHGLSGLPNPLSASPRSPCSLVRPRAPSCTPEGYRRGYRRIPLPRIGQILARSQPPVPRRGCKPRLSVRSPNVEPEPAAISYQPQNEQAASRRYAVARFQPCVSRNRKDTRWEQSRPRRIGFQLAWHFANGFVQRLAGFAPPPPVAARIAPQLPPAGLDGVPEYTCFVHVQSPSAVCHHCCSAIASGAAGDQNSCQ